MERQAVKSSQIKAVGYQRDNSILEIEFHNGGVYRYEGVSQEMADAFVRAPSLGQFLHQHIKGKFPHHRAHSDG